MTTSVLHSSTTSIPSTPLQHAKVKSHKRAGEGLSLLVDVPCHKRPRPAIKQTKKAVRFDLFHNSCCSTECVILVEDEDSSIKTTSASECWDGAELEDRTVLNRDQLWFSADDLYKIRLREANIVKIHRFSDDYMEEAASLLGSAVRSVTLGVNTDKQQARAPTAAEYGYYLAGSAARGLESQIVPCIRQRRKQVVTTFLKSQRSLANYRIPTDGSSFSVDWQQRALSEHYQKLAGPAQRVAHWLAAGDALVARKAA